MNSQAFNFTPGGSQVQPSYESWCVKFLTLVERTLSEVVDTPQTSATDRSPRVNMARAFDRLEENDRYARLFEFLRMKSQTDNGDLVAKMVIGLSVGLRHSCDPPKHRISVLQHIFSIFEATSLSAHNYSATTRVLKTLLTECSPRDLDQLRQEIKTGFVNGAYRSRRAFDALVGTMTCIQAGEPAAHPDISQAQTAVLDILFRESTDASCETISRLIREHSAMEVFTRFIEGAMHTTAEGVGLDNPLIWQKVGLALQGLEQHELVVVLDRLSEHWKSVGNQQLVHHLAGFALLQEFFGSRPTFAVVVIKSLKAKRLCIWDNTFWILCLHLLCSLDRHTNEVAAMMTSSLKVLWQNQALLDRNLWMRSVLTGECVTQIRQRITAVVELMESSGEWFKLIGPALERVSMNIMVESAKGAELRVSGGQLKDSAEVAFMARYVFVAVAMNNQYGIAQQLSRLIDAVFASVPSSSVAYLLVDILLEITRRGTAVLMNATEAFANLVENVWVLPGEVGVVLIRSILPVLNHRPAFKALLLERLKIHLSRPASISTTLPILLTLWRSVTEHPSVAKNPRFMMSQSFATFSSLTLGNAGMNKHVEQAQMLELVGLVRRLLGQSATAKRLISQGLVDICQKVPAFAVQALDLLLPQIQCLPPLEAEAFINVSKYGFEVKIPVAQLVMAISKLLRITIANAGNNEVAHTVAHMADEAIEHVIREVASKAQDSAPLKNRVDFGATSQGRKNLAFGAVMIQLYDVMIEHMWNISGGEITADQANVLQKMFATRDELHEIVQGKTQDDELRMDAQDLHSLLRDLLSYEITETNQNLEPLIKDRLLPWAISKINEHTAGLSPYAMTGAISLPCYATIAQSLMRLLLGDDHVIEPLRSIKQHSPIKSLALECYARLVKYFIARYAQGAEQSLQNLLACFVDIDFEQIHAPSMQDRTVNQNKSHEWASVLSRHFYVYGSAMLNSLLSPAFTAEFHAEQRDSELQHQVGTLVDLCCFIAKITPNATGVTQRYYVQIFSKRLESYAFDENRVLRDLFQTTFGLLLNSNCGESATRKIHVVMEQVNLAAQGPENNASGWKSITHENYEEVFVQLLNCLEQFYRNVRQTLATKLEADRALGDEFIAKICETVYRFGGATLQAVEFCVMHACQADQTTVTLTQLYDTMTELFKQVERAAKAHQGANVNEWRCVNTLEEITRECIVPVRDKCAHSAMGSWDAQAAELRVQRKARKVAQQKRIYVAHAKAVERMVVAALMVGKIVDRDTFSLQELPVFRCFIIDIAAVVQRYERNFGDAVEINEEEQDGSGEEDAENRSPSH